jgi:hypothetical protein
MGVRPLGYTAAEGVKVRIPYNSIPAEHADVRRKLARGWILGEVTGEDSALFKYAALYPPTTA